MEPMMRMIIVITMEGRNDLTMYNIMMYIQQLNPMSCITEYCKVARLNLYRNTKGYELLFFLFYVPICNNTFIHLPVILYFLLIINTKNRSWSVDRIWLLSIK